MEKDISETLFYLSRCKEACATFIDTALNLPDPYRFKKSIELSKDCQQICASTAEFISRGSGQSKKILKFCAELCHKCSDELLKISSFEESRYCQEVCRACAQQCAVAS